MDEHQIDELATLRNLLEGLESGRMKLRKDGEDISRREISILKREIAHLEEIIVDLKLRLSVARNA